MTRSLLLICTLAVWAVIFCPINSEAGTFMVGGKGWYAFWDSSVLDWFDKDIAAGYRDNGLVLTSEKDAGSGYLVGPFVGYQTDSGKWSVSLAAMAFSLEFLVVAACTVVILGGVAWTVRRSDR